MRTGYNDLSMLINEDRAPLTDALLFLEVFV